MQILRAAAHHFDLINLGVIELDAKSEKLLNWYMHFDDSTKPLSDNKVNNWWCRDLKNYKGDTTIGGGRLLWNL